MASLLSVFKKQPKKDPVEEVKQVKTDIRAQIAKLRQTRAVKEKQCQDLLRSALAKKKQKNIIGAKDDLRKKELLKTSIMHINGQILGLETQLNAHDQAEMSREFLATMTASAKSLKNLVKETHVNETEAAAADIQESMQLVQQLQQATSQSLGITSTNDELLSSELEELGIEEEETTESDAMDAAAYELEDEDKLKHLDKDLAAMKFPSVPNKPPVAAQKQQRQVVTTAPVAIPMTATPVAIPTTQATNRNQAMQILQAPIGGPMVVTQSAIQQQTVVARMPSRPQPTQQADADDDEQEAGLETLEKWLKN